VSPSLVRIGFGAGRVNGSDGSLGNVGSNGNYWSSTPNGDSNGYRLNFNSSSVNPSNNANRYNGYSVRCLVSLCPISVERITKPPSQDSRKGITA